MRPSRRTLSSRSFPTALPSVSPSAHHDAAVAGHDAEICPRTDLKRAHRVAKMSFQQLHVLGLQLLEIVEVLHDEDRVARNLAHRDHEGHLLPVIDVDADEGEVVAIEVAALAPQIRSEGNAEIVGDVLADHAGCERRKVQILSPFAHDRRMRAPGVRRELQRVVQIAELA